MALDFAPLLEVTDREEGIKNFIEVANEPSDLAEVYVLEEIQEELKVKFVNDKQMRMVKTICKHHYGQATLWASCGAHDGAGLSWHQIQGRAHEIHDEGQLCQMVQGDVLARALPC